MQVLGFHLTDALFPSPSGHEVASFYHLSTHLAQSHLDAEVSICVHHIVYHKYT